MPRSTYIYIAQDEEKNVLVARTVKHELETWLAGRADRTELVVLRCPDTYRDGAPTRLDPVTLDPFGGTR